MSQKLYSQIVETDVGYTVKTERKYSDVVSTNTITVAYSEEREEIVKYDKDFIMLEKMDRIKNFKKHPYKNVVFVEFKQYGWTQIMILQDDRNDMVTLQSSTTSSVETIKIIEIIQIEPKKYLVIGEYYDTWDHVHYTIYYVIDLHVGQELFKLILQRASDRYYKILEKRFLLYDYNYGYGFKLYDLYTMNKMKLPMFRQEDSDKIKTTKTFDIIKVCYSQKNVMVVKILDNYFVYIQGNVVYTYTEEEYEEIISYLKNYHTESKRYCKVIIRDKLILWTKDKELEIITLPQK